MNSRRYFLALSLVFGYAGQAAAEVQWAPYLTAELYGGYSRFSGENVDGPNGSLLFVPGLRAGERFSLLPAFAAGYRATRDVRELAGGGFLTQESQEYSGSLKGIYVLSPGWKGKAYASYKRELLKETSDERWGDGLFDNGKLAFGLELEREGARWRSLRGGVDYYTTTFPNFQSLSSQQGFGAEIQAGTDVLDFNALDGALAADLSLGGRSLLSGYLLVSSRDFKDQKIVQLSGTYSNEARHDLYSYASLGYRRELPTFSFFGMGVESLAGLDLTYAFQDSDQNNYDASASSPTFNRNYYDYAEYGVGPRINLRFKEKLSMGLSYLFESRSYADRPVQAADGTYGADPISNKTTTFRWSLGYPLMKGLAVQLQGALQHADSNMEYERVYRYNYSSSHYFLGLSYQL